MRPCGQPGGGAIQVQPHGPGVGLPGQGEGGPRPPGCRASSGSPPPPTSSFSSSPPPPPPAHLSDQGEPGLSEHLLICRRPVPHCRQSGGRWRDTRGRHHLPFVLRRPPFTASPPHLMSSEKGESDSELRSELQT